MDKLRPILAGLAKYHFWMLCVVVMLVVLFGWYSMYDEAPVSFQANTAKVASSFSAVDTVNNRKPAGPTFPDDAQKKARAIKDALARVTRKMQAFQAAGIREWPKELSRGFMDLVTRQGRTGTWPVERLAEYQKVGPEEVDKLKALVGAAESDDTSGVHWSETDFRTFREQYQWVAPPQVVSIFEGQEKLWIAQAVLGAIAETNNKPGVDKFNLPVAAIELFEVGPLASRDWTVQAVEGFGPQPAPKTPPPDQAGMAAPVAGKPPVAAKATPPVKGKPAPAPVAPPAPAPVVVAPAAKPVKGLRAYPVRMRLRMDFAAVLPLLVALENHRLTFVIEDVHLDNPLTLIEKKAPEQPKPAPAAAGAFGAAAPAPAVDPNPAPVDLGPPLLVQIPRGSIVEIQATCYLADPTAIEALKVAMLGGPIR